MYIIDSRTKNCTRK